MSLVFPSYSWCQTFKEFEERAQLLYKNGDLELAIIEYSKALLFFPKNPIAYYNRGVYNLEFYELETAIIDFKKSIKYDFPEPAYPLTNIGTCFSELGNLDSALVYFDQSLEIEPEFFSVLKDKVLVLFKLGKLDQAIENFNQALKIEPKYAAALAGRGQVFQDLGELKKAEKDFIEHCRVKDGLNGIRNAEVEEAPQQGESRVHKEKFVPDPHEIDSGKEAFDDGGIRLRRQEPVAEKRII